MTNKTKKITILTTALAGSLLATSIGAVALSACGTTTAPQTPTEDPNKEFEGTSFTKKINWNDEAAVKDLIKDEQGLIFADDKKIEVIAINPSSESTVITIPSSVRAITGYTDITNDSNGVAKGAFESSKVQKIDFAGNTYTIGKQAFRNAKELATIKLPNSLSIIDNNAFEGCSKLGLFDLKSVKVIGNSAFKDAFPTVTKTTKEGETTETPITSISLTKAITIGDNAFENANLKNINFDGNTQLRSIGVAAFRDSKLSGTLDLSKLTNLTEIENETFKNTSKLVNITLPESITVLGKSVFESTSATTINLKSTQITTIPEKTFYNASKLNNLELNDRIITFENNSFQGTTELKTLTLPASLKELGFNVFNRDYETNVGASGINGLDFSGTQVTKIPHLAFSGMKSLSSLKLNDNTSSLGSYMLADSELTTLDLNNIKTTLTSIPTFAFNSATKLSTLNIDQTSITTFRSNSFQNTPKLVTLKVPATLKTIEPNTFNSTETTGSSKLTSDQNKPAGLTSLDLSTTKTAVTLPDNAFKGCEKLQTVALHPNTTTIPTSAFANSGLQNLSFGTTKKAGDQDSQATSKKLDFTNGTNVETIGDYAFEGTQFIEADLSKVNDKLTTIPTGIFKNANELKTVTLKNVTTTIKTGAFEGNGKLASVNFDKLISLETIETKNFNGTALTSLALNKTKLTAISADTFKDMTGTLTSVDLPITIASIAEGSLTKKSTTEGQNATKLGITYKDKNDNITVPSSIDGDTDTSKLDALGFKDSPEVNLSSMANLDTISPGTFNEATKLSKITLPSKAVKWKLDKNDGNRATTYSNNPFYNNSKNLNIEFTAFTKSGGTPSQFSEIDENTKQQIANIMNMFSHYTPAGDKIPVQYDAWDRSSGDTERPWFTATSDAITKTNVFEKWAKGDGTEETLDKTKNGYTKNYNGVEWIFEVDGENITIKTKANTYVNMYRAISDEATDWNNADQGSFVNNKGHQAYFNAPAEDGGPDQNLQVTVTMKIVVAKPAGN